MTFVLIVLLLGVAYWGFKASSANTELRRRNEAVSAELSQVQANNYALHQHSVGLQQQMQQVAAENQQLARYRAIVDVEREIYQMRTAVAAEVATARQQVGVEVAAAQQQAAGVVGSAHQQAAGVMADAYSKAQAIASDALDAKRNVEAYRLEAQALKNVIEGYGDRYLVATETILDGLAESFGHTEAGAKLKETRQRSKGLIKNGQAAGCEYVEPERRHAAIEFVIDAFNGKVETILAKAKADNFGTLRQELVDAYSIVNMNGRAFRNAHIFNGYLGMRIEELHWAVVVHELRDRERDEQRRIKEQIREEEKARRDYERAQKEAAKEEDVIRRAMARAQQEILQATDAQRSKYEAQLLELGVRLQAAEEKNRRALSMAQQTKRGHVYIISNVGSFGEDVFKIGLTRRLEPMDRIKELGDASVPFEFDVHALISSEDAPALEHALHRHFLASQMNKVNARKEFFKATLTMIRAEVEKLGIKAGWTMTAAAAQYRESQAIERAIKDDPAAYQAWLKRQLVLERVAIRDEEDEEDGDTGRAPAVAAPN